MKVRIRLYGFLVNRIPGIGERYRKKRECVQGLGRAGAWMYLLWLNFAYYVLRNKELKSLDKYPYYEEKQLYLSGSESSLSLRESPSQLAARLAEYDVISFDVFDTLIFRPFSRPDDLFYFIARKLEYPDFQSIRCKMEEQARQKLYDRIGSREVKLSEIYELLEAETGIGQEEGMLAEVETEYRFCYANSYMHQVIQELIKKGKRIVITSDMYLDEAYIRTILKRAGYPEFDACYISCEYRCSKGEGTLFEKVKETEGKDKRFVHVGDHVIADIEQAKKHGFETVYYKNVNTTGMRFRAEDMSVMTGSVYRGMVNEHLHNGLCKYQLPYEYGFVYGGLFVTGYCQFIHNYAKQHAIDKILFLARDGDVLSKAYEKMYPGECQEYVYWSRLAATKLAAVRYKHDFFRRFLYQKVNQNYTIYEILIAMELEDMCADLEVEGGLQKTDRLTERNVEKVKRYLLKRWEKVLQRYKPQIETAGQYYREVLKGCHNVVAVDIGWAGSGAVTLSYMVRHEWNMDCGLVGIIAGTNTCHNYESNISEAQLASGELVSYMYSQKVNRDIWKYHNPGKNHNLYWEMLLDSPTGSLKGFYPAADGGYEIVLKEPSKFGRSIELVQAGILDFVDKYLQIMGDEPLEISGRDAYAPMLVAMGEKNRKFMAQLEFLMDEVNV